MFKVLGKYKNEWVYDIDVYSSQILVVIGPEGLTQDMVNEGDVPDEWRWISGDEWEKFYSNM
jgi:hypothetical protein